MRSFIRVSRADRGDGCVSVADRAVGRPHAARRSAQRQRVSPISTGRCRERQMASPTSLASGKADSLANQAAPTDAPAGPPLAGFRDVAQNIKEGLPLKPEGAAILKERQAGNSKDNPEAHCLPMGIVQFHTQGAPRKFIQTPGLLVILYEASSGVRQIFTDGRALPNNDPQPWWYGYSVGKWDGDTLVVETTGLRDGGWLDIVGTPLSDVAKLTERFRRVSYGRMEIDITVDDHEALYASLDCPRQPADHAGPGTDRIHLSRESAIRRSVAATTAGRSPSSSPRRDDICSKASTTIAWT